MRLQTTQSSATSILQEGPTSNTRKGLTAFLLWLSLSILGTSFFGCASKPRLANHSFSFDARTDSPDTEILDWRYGDSKIHGARPEAYMLRMGRVPQQIGTSGQMRVGKDLYVKWRVKSSNTIFEKTVDLQSNFSRNLEGHAIRFIASQSILYVYLITPEKRTPNPCPPDRRRLLLDKSGEPDQVMFSMYCSRVILRLHPVSGMVPAFS